MNYDIKKGIYSKLVNCIQNSIPYYLEIRFIIQYIILNVVVVYALLQKVVSSYKFAKYILRLK